jgi:hypothetical protein
MARETVFAADFRVTHWNSLSDFTERHPFQFQEDDRALGVFEFINFQTQFHQCLSLCTAFLNTLWYRK